MSCEDCGNAEKEVAIPIRVGNDEVGYGNVLIVGCDAHAKLAFWQWRAGDGGAAAERDLRWLRLSDEACTAAWHRIHYVGRPRPDMQLAQAFLARLEEWHTFKVERGLIPE